jgi:hypothetical protein
MPFMDVCVHLHSNVDSSAEKPENSIEAATKLKKRNVTYFCCCSVIVPQGKFLSFLTLNLSLFIFVVFCVRELRVLWGGERVVLLIGSMAAACARHKPKTFFCTFFSQPPSENRYSAFFHKGNFLLSYSKSIDIKGKCFEEGKMKVLTDVLFFKQQR